MWFFNISNFRKLHCVELVVRSKRKSPFCQDATNLCCGWGKQWNSSFDDNQTWIQCNNKTSWLRLAKLDLRFAHLSPSLFFYASLEINFFSSLIRQGFKKKLKNSGNIKTLEIAKNRFCPTFLFLPFCEGKFGSNFDFTLIICHILKIMTIEIEVIKSDYQPKIWPDFPQ